jgi:hypothetical protein
MNDEFPTGATENDLTRDDLGSILEYIQQHTDQLAGGSVIRLAAAFQRMAEDGVVQIDKLPQTDIDELWSLVTHIAVENDLRWQIGE